MRYRARPTFVARPCNQENFGRLFTDIWAANVVSLCLLKITTHYTLRIIDHLALVAVQQSYSPRCRDDLSLDNLVNWVGRYHWNIRAVLTFYAKRQRVELNRVPQSVDWPWTRGAHSYIRVCQSGLTI